VTRVRLNLLRALVLAACLAPREAVCTVNRAGGLNDIHLHPTIPRTFRVNFIVGR
jgi:hypothetical protein